MNSIFYISFFIFSITFFCCVNVSNQKLFFFTTDQNKLLNNKINQLETFVDLVTKTGYIAEEHEVITEDGYYLLLHRISGGPQNPVRSGKPVVLLLHGLMGASDIWVLRGPRYDIAYRLVDNGFDVWALNVRGNFYCKRHRNYSDQDMKFWEFSWHEIGFYDLPASIDYILSLTQQSKISLIGYSMGATEEFVLLSTRPNYNAKVNVALAWAPVVMVTHELPGLLINFMLRYGNHLEKVFQFFNLYELFPRLTMKQLDAAEFWLKLCWNRSVQSFCHRVMDFIFGVNNLNVDFPTLKKFWSHYPQGTSIKTIIHYGQIVLHRKFVQYDFGSDLNQEKYNNVQPAEYPIENISTPLIIYHSSGDNISNKQDVEAVLSRVSAAVAREVPSPNFGHIDFIGSNNNTKELYDDVIDILVFYNKNYYKNDSLSKSL